METRGYETINDRTSGWGPGVDGDAQPDADATPEANATRLARTRVARQVGDPTVTPSTEDRKRGYGGDYDATAGAGDYGVVDWESSDETVGTDYALEYSGSNTALDDSHSEQSVSNRTAKALPTSDLVEPGIETVGSIVDRTSGFGHTDGSQSDRKDS